MSAEKPIGISLVICDQIIEDSASRKRSLIGLFSSIQCGSFPATLHKVCVFVALTNLNGNYAIELRCNNETANEPIITAKASTDSNNPNDILELGFEFDLFSFPKPGLYNFELYCNSELILLNRFNVLRLSNT